MRMGLHATVARRRSAVVLAGALACAAALGGCKAKEMRLEDKVLYILYNHSGKSVVAPTVADSAGGHGALEYTIADRDAGYLGSVRSFAKGTSITVQWIGGEGRARWYQATLPVKIEQAGGKFVEVHLRPDGFVCASLVDDAHQARRSQAHMLAMARQDRGTLSCARQVELPPLRPGMAAEFVQRAEAHSWELYDRAAKSTLVLETIEHRTGPVALRFEDDYKGGPYYISRFLWARPLGDRAAWLAQARASTELSLFIVTGNGAGWASRFLGAVGEGETRLADSRILFGKRTIVDTATADVFVLPRYPGIEYWVLGQSPDGRRIAVYWETRGSGGNSRDGVKSGVSLLNLETGQDEDAPAARPPELPPNSIIYRFYGDWYRDRCSWKPELTCR